MGLLRSIVALGAILTAILGGLSASAVPGDILATYQDPNGGQDDEFGFAVAAVDGLALVAAPAKPGGGSVFVFSTDTTVPLGTLPLPAGYTPGRLGHALATTGGLLLVADPEAQLPGGGKGAVLLYESLSDSEPTILANPENQADDKFASVIGVGPDGLFAIGAPYYPLGVPNEPDVTGRVYVYSALSNPPSPIYTLSNPDTDSYRAPSVFGLNIVFSHSDHLAIGRSETGQHYLNHIYDAMTGDFLRYGQYGKTHLSFDGNLAVAYSNFNVSTWGSHHMVGFFDWDTGALLNSYETTITFGRYFDYGMSAGPGFMFVGAAPIPYDGPYPARLYAVNPEGETPLTVLYEQNYTDFGFSTAALHGDALVGAPARIESAWDIRPFPTAYLVEGPLVLPQSPTGLQLELKPNREVELTFSDNSYNEDGFVLQRKVGQFSYQTIATLPVGITQWTDTLSSFVGGRIEYRVQAYNGAGSSGFASSSVDVGPSSHAPSNLQAEQLTPSTIQISYLDNSSSESGFRVKRTDSASSNTVVETLSANTTQFVDSNIVAERTYCYSVVAFNNEGETNWAEPVYITTLPLGGVDLSGSLEALQECELRGDRIRCKLLLSVIARNRGAETAKPTVARIYLSDDSTLDVGDEQLKQVRISKIRPGEEVLRGLKKKRKVSLSGKYLILQVDAKGKLDERDEGNNEFVCGPLP